ncbi:protein of unknown function DUF43 [Methanococcus vannielii SB]|uniref:N(4)-bis(aminopropyl)spermidine synthase C-terminal domain-containing protein n=1 Tax=Methanococcus vannielii (strain ATCC 35089 / DSM 1224 / JCM 13029 / OCM 148 / SB) TaxID=406327 RepID=A6UQT8_METVS|nr:bis-aminopropyl spermidine synthase family protein [Methanococcus vannielii]ABR54860.1 protein of unknown function DUF43 [Methanococcus vannielii SB]
MKVIGSMGKPTEKTDISAKKTILKRIARNVSVSEGERAIEDIIRCIYRNQPISTKKIGQYVKLPLPIVSKVRTILEREGLLKRGERGAIFSKEGIDFVETQLGLKLKSDLKCPVCSGGNIVFDEKFEKILKRHENYAKLRPQVNTMIDQSFATPETAVKRACIMADRGDLEGKRVLFIGDDDLASIPTAMTKLCKEVVVLDIDERLLNLILEVSKKENLNIKTIHWDFKNELPKELHEKFDTVFTDPPYTLNGAVLFMSRGIEALGNDGVLYLAFSHKPVEEYIELQKSINNMNFLIYELIPGFNFYEGTEIIGNTTFLARLIGKNLKKIEVDFKKIYTGELKPTLRYYRCMKCEKIHEVGDKIKRIEELTCECGGKKFSMVKRLKVKENTELNNY